MFWRRVIETGNQTEADLHHAISLVEQTGSIQETMRRARAYADAAKAALAVLAGQRDPQRLVRHRGFLRRKSLLVRAVRLG